MECPRRSCSQHREYVRVVQLDNDGTGNNRGPNSRDLELAAGGLRHQQREFQNSVIGVPADGVARLVMEPTYPGYDVTPLHRDVDPAERY